MSVYQPPNRHQEVCTQMLMRFDPFRELDRLAQTSWPARVPTLPLDAYRDGDRFIVHVDLPGVDPGSIDLTVEQNVLTVSAARRWERGESQEILVQERPQGAFSRQLFLGDSLDPDRIEASYDNGVLTLTVPVAEQAKARKVEISTGGSKPEAIETTAA